MHTDDVSLGEVGARLRAERERLGFNQADFGEVGGVTRNSQANYESGKRPCDAAYLLSLQRRGIDVSYIFTGRRTSDALRDDEHELLASFRALDASNQSALLTIAQTMAGRSMPSRALHTPRPDYAGEERRG